MLPALGPCPILCHLFTMMLDLIIGSPRPWLFIIYPTLLFPFEHRLVDFSELGEGGAHLEGPGPWFYLCELVRWISSSVFTLWMQNSNRILPIWASHRIQWIRGSDLEGPWFDINKLVKFEMDFITSLDPMVWIKTLLFPFEHLLVEFGY